MESNIPEVIATMSNATYRGSGGYTPVKGVDYFTEEEIAELKSEISVDPISNQAILNMFNNLDL
jgi:hypothetical protein